MAQQETRRQQIARRLRLSERALEQYLQLKRAEVEDDSGVETLASSAGTAERREHLSEQRQGYEEKRV